MLRSSEPGPAREEDSDEEVQIHGGTARVCPEASRAAYSGCRTTRPSIPNRDRPPLRQATSADRLAQACGVGAANGDTLGHFPTKDVPGSLLPRDQQANSAFIAVSLSPREIPWTNTPPLQARRRSDDSCPASGSILIWQDKMTSSSTVLEPARRHPRHRHLQCVHRLRTTIAGH